MDDKRLCKQAYNRFISLSKQGSSKWVTKIKYDLESDGFGIVWLSKGVGNDLLFLRDFQFRLIDCFKQSWHSKMSNNKNCSTLLFL